MTAGSPPARGRPRAAALASLMLVVAAFAVGCSPKEPSPSASDTPVKHKHQAPHGGTPVALGEEAYHLELVWVAAEGKLQAFVLDGEMEEFVRCPALSFEVVTTGDGGPRPLLFTAVADPATGETAGDTALYEAPAGWIQTTREFDAVLTRLTIRGTTFSGVSFHFPAGNDRDKQP